METGLILANVAPVWPVLHLPSVPRPKATTGSQPMTSRPNRVACCAVLAAVVFAASCSQSRANREIKAGWKSVPHVVNPDVEREDRELELREFIFRREIARPVRDEIVFVS